MGLLLPDPGLLFWMTVAFLVVFILLAKLGFPVILRSVQKREDYIAGSIVSAREAERRLKELDAEGKKITAQAEQRREEILHDAIRQRDLILQKARRAADKEGARIVAAAREKAEVERAALLQEARHHVALLSVAVAEKILRERLQDDGLQDRLIGKLIDEVEQAHGVSGAAKE